MIRLVSNLPVRILSFRIIGPIAESSAEVKLVLPLIARWLDCLAAFALECSSREVRRSNVRLIMTSKDEGRGVVENKSAMFYFLRV